MQGEKWAWAKAEIPKDRTGPVCVCSSWAGWQSGWEARGWEGWRREEMRRAGSGCGAILSREFWFCSPIMGSTTGWWVLREPLWQRWDRQQSKIRNRPSSSPWCLWKRSRWDDDPNEAKTPWLHLASSQHWAFSLSSFSICTNGPGPPFSQGSSSSCLFHLFPLVCNSLNLCPKPTD